jgi:hypothetical protein
MIIGAVVHNPRESGTTGPVEVPDTFSTGNRQEKTHVGISKVDRSLFGWSITTDAEG